MGKKNDTPPACAYCGGPDATHRDHVVPRSRGGPDSGRNIVMACQACNAAKHDRLPSEWLGPKCPAAILMIEIQNHDRLRKRFSYRDKAAPKAPKVFAFSTGDDGKTEYMGEVVAESGDSVRLAVVNWLHVWAGFWDPSGELRDVPRARCRFFNDRDQCVEAADRNTRSYERRQQLATA